MLVVDWSISDRRLNWKPLLFPLCFNHSVNVTIVFFIPSIHLTRVTVNDTFGVVLLERKKNGQIKGMINSGLLFPKYIVQLIIT